MPVGNIIRLIAKLSLFAGLVCVAPVSAYQANGVSWPQSTTVFYVDIPGAGGLWNSAFETAMSGWGVDTSFVYNIVRGVYADPCNRFDGRNGVGFESTACGDAWGSTTLAFTGWRFTGATLIEADIFFNSNFDWDVYSGSRLFSAKDFRRVAVHELGHALGLGHENQNPAIMAATIGNIEVPQQDDINGVAAIYGPVDVDNDGIPDSQDNCPGISNASQIETDSDGAGDVCDDDDDNDGVLDRADISSLNPDICADTDNDSCDDCTVGVDNFGPLPDNTPNNDGIDTDSDSLCNLGDTDDDNDGMPDSYEIENGLDPLDSSDASGDADGDGLSNIEEYRIHSETNDPI